MNAIEHAIATPITIERGLMPVCCATLIAIGPITAAATAPLTACVKIRREKHHSTEYHDRSVTGESLIDVTCDQARGIGFYKRNAHRQHSGDKKDALPSDGGIRLLRS